jgi:hypothetical protein
MMLLAVYEVREKLEEWQIGYNRSMQQSLPGYGLPER